MRRVVFGLVSSFLLAQVVACNVDDPSAPAERPAEKQAQPIIGGTLDTTNPATVYLEGQMGNQGYACSGTIIAVNGNVGYVLTAGHCVAGTITNVYIGSNLNAAVPHAALQQWQHPNYNTQTLRYDFGMVAFDGANANTPVIPAAQSPDGVSPNGTQLELSGYGLTQAGNPPSGQTTNRLKVTESSSDLVAMLGNQAPDTSIQIGFNQTNGKGTCEGDSGGPAYLGTGASRRVVGVTSYGDQACAQFGVSGRVSAVYSTFIEPILNGQPPMQTCDTCVQSATSPGGSCDSQVQACLGNSSCNALANCLQSCAANDQACVNQCASTNAAGVSLYNAIFDCAYCSACTQYCSQAQCTMSSANAATSGVGATTGSGVGATTGSGAGVGGAGAGGASSTGSSNGNTGGSGGTTTTVTKCAACAVAPDDDGHGALAGIAALGIVGLAFASRRRR